MRQPLLPPLCLFFFLLLYSLLLSSMLSSHLLPLLRLSDPPWLPSGAASPSFATWAALPEPFCLQPLGLPKLCSSRS